MSKFNTLNVTEVLFPSAIARPGADVGSGDHTLSGLPVYVGSYDPGERAAGEFRAIYEPGVADLVAGGAGNIGSASSISDSIGGSVHGSVPTLQLPDLAAPDLDGFLKDHGIDLGNDAGGGGHIDLGGSDDNQGPMSGLPSPTGGNGGADMPGVDLGHGGISGVGVPKGLDLGDNTHLSGLGVPKGIDIGGDQLSGLGVPDSIGDHGGISGPGVPNGSGSVGVGGFKPSDFDNGHLTDAPDDGGGKGGGSWWGSAWSNLSHGHFADAGLDVATAIVADGAARSNNGDHLAGGMEQAAGAFAGAVTAGAVAVAVGAAGPIGVAIAVATSAVVNEPDTKPKDDTKPDPAPNPDPGKGNQPVDDSGTGPAHPTTHNNEQPVDDSGAGPVHPMTSSTAQPVDDSGLGPVHPSTHLGAVAVDAPGMVSANLAALPVDDGETSGHDKDVGVGHAFGGHSAAFWDAAVQSIADSQHANAATANATVADASASVAHADAFGIFAHSSAPAFVAGASVADSHANLDALATTHIDNTHVEIDASHSFHAELNLSHLNLHI